MARHPAESKQGFGVPGYHSFQCDETRGTGINQEFPELAPSQRRLQRPPDFTGGTLASFSAVFLRHGLPAAIFGALCLLHPDLRALLAEALSGPVAAPLRFFTMAIAIFASLSAYVWYLDKKLDLRQIGWIFYLLLVSIWEEWVFRLAIPYFANAQAVNLDVAVITSNLLFGLIHYFTLRWKWTWCLAAFLGGLGLSQHMASHFDLAAVIGIHWIATTLNTPRLPGQSRPPDYGQHYL